MDWTKERGPGRGRAGSVADVRGRQLSGAAITLQAPLANRDRPPLRLSFGAAALPPPPPASPGPLRRQRGEKIADWLTRWRAAGLPVPPLDQRGLPLPLAIGTLEALIAQRRAPGTCSPHRLKRLLGWYCNQPVYLHVLSREGAMRHTLDGEAVEPVSPEHREGAIARLEALRKRPDL